MPLIGTLTSGSLGTFGLAQQAQIAILKATTAISGSVPVSADWSNTTLAHTLDNPNPHGTSENDRFGSAVAMSSTHAIVGTYYESDANGTMAGKAYIYNIATGALLYTLDNPNPYGTSTDDRFGFSVAISDTYAIVGAFQEDDAGGNSSGKAYIYSLSDGSLIKTLSNRDPDASALGDLFGFSVAISDTYAIVGAWGEDWPSGGGAAYIYDISSLSSDGSVPLPTIIKNASTSSPTNAYFGWAVALSDNYVIVSAPNAFSATGQAFVFNLSDGSLLYTFDNPNPNTNDGFGGDLNPAQSPTMLAISDNYAIVSTAVGNPASGDLSGKVYVFDLSDGSLAYTLDNPNAFGTTDGDRFGMTVDLDDDFVIVGAPYEDDAGGTTSGKAYIYNLTDGSLVRTLDDPNAVGTTDGDIFGHSVAINDGIAIVSASLEDDAGGTDSGKVYIFNAPEAAPASAEWSIDLSNVTYDNVSFDVSSQANHLALGQSFNNDGTKMYIIAIERQSSSNYARNMFQYTLSTGFDISTASYDNVSFIDLSEELYFFDVKFNNDGTKMYMIGTSSESIYQYTLSTGFDISTSSYDNVSFSVESEDVSPMRIIFKNDGTKMYILGGNSDTVYQYTLSTSFDISTASYDSVNFYVGSTPSLGPNEGYAIDLSSDGTKLYRVGLETSDVYQYTLSTPFDLSTASYDSVTFNVDSYEGTITDVTFSGDGTKMYILGDNKTTYQYSTGL